MDFCRASAPNRSPELMIPTFCGVRNKGRIVRASFLNLFRSVDLASLALARRDHAALVIRWTLALVLMSIAVGTLCAAFLWSLDAATTLRFVHPWLLFLLPIGGAAIGIAEHSRAGRVLLCS